MGRAQGVKAWQKLGTVALLVLASCFLWHSWKQDEPRRNSLTALHDLHDALGSNNADSLLNAIVLPQALQSRTEPEQVEFLRKALQDEISSEGLAALKSKGKFGSLNQIFPREGEAWARQAVAKPEDCVAFKMEEAGIRA